MKIFFITSRFPFPIDKGDKLRAYHQIKNLSKNHSIYLFSIVTKRPNQKFVSELDNFVDKYQIFQLSKFRLFLNLVTSIFSNIPFQSKLFYSNRAHQKIKNAIKEYSPDIIFYQLIRTTEYMVNNEKSLHVVDFIDALSKGLALRAKHSNFIIKHFVKTEQKRVEKYESKIYLETDKSIIITQNDLMQLKINDNTKIKVIPNGIDTSYFKPSKIMPKEIDILFVGNMNYSPNVESMRFFVKNVWPRIITKNSDIKFTIAGANPSNYIKKLSSQNISVTGWVEDIREYYQKSKIFIAPMQSGTGLQNKILEAMSMELPCIISPLAQKGIEGANEQNSLIYQNIDEFVELIFELLENAEKRNEIGEKAREFVIQNYSWSTIANQLSDYLSNSKTSN